MVFYMKEVEEIYDVDALHDNFTLRLPFREANLDHDSPVGILCLFLVANRHDLKSQTIFMIFFFSAIFEEMN